MTDQESPKRRRGRPSGVGRAYKLTDWSKGRIVHAIILGEPVEIAARYGRVDFSTMDRWTKEGERLALRQEKGIEPTEEEQKLIDFYYEIEDAKLESEIRAAHALDTGFTGIKTQVTETKTDREGNVTVKEYEKFILLPDYKAAVEKLARRCPERWAKKDQLEHMGNKDNPIVIQTLADFVRSAAERRKQQVKDVGKG